MNIVRKLMTGRSSVEAEDDDGDPREERLLGLSHLKKLISEGGHDLGDLIPLFIQVAGPEPNSIFDTLGSSFVRSLADSAAKSLVSSVRDRASSRNTETASKAIAQYLQVSSSDDENNGWPLLSALNICGRVEDESLVETLNRASLPSTLVKCIYLFFDLPLPEDEQTDQAAELTDKETKMLLQKMLSQILLRLCSYVSVVEDLARKDDLLLLFAAVTSSCPEHNAIWRKTASDILLAISRHSLSQPVISTLHNKGCIALCVANMHASTDLKPLEIVEMFVTVFCFLKDSTETSQTLMEDFRTCQGYIFLSDFLLKLEQTVDTESNEAIRNLVLLVASLSFCGTTELKPNTSMMSHYQLPNFQLPEPENQGNTVKNIHAFQVLQTVFLKSSSAQLGGTILDGISTVYTSDNANFFLLGNQSTLPKCAEKISHKPKIVQEKFFQLIEFVIYHLKFVPCNELIAISLLLKSSQNIESCNLALKSLISVLKFDTIFKDVFREVGLLEVVVGGLRAYTSSLLEKNVLDEPLKTYGELGVHISTELLIGNSANAGVFRETGGCSVLLDLVKNDKSRSMALNVYRQLIFSGGKEEDMNSLLENLHAQSTSIQAKIDILQTIIGCMKESHRPRSSFRKVGGFNYVVSIIASVEGTLTGKANHESVLIIYRVLESIFTCITVAMRYEPANANLFESEIAFSYNLVDILRLLGCFSSGSTMTISQCGGTYQEFLSNDTFQKEFQLLFEKNETPSIPIRIRSACIVLRMMYDTALGKYEIRRPNLPSSLGLADEDINNKDDEKGSRKRIAHLNLQPVPPDPVIVHPAVVSSILKLIPYMSLAEEEDVSDIEKEYGYFLQFYISEKILKSLLRSEKNQQIMSEVGFLTDILYIAKIPLENENHSLHLPYQYLLERLAAQKLEPMDLRTFFRLGNPLSCCAGLSSLNTTSLPLNRIKTLVSMTTPRDSHIQNNSILPPFIEFDMSPEGFGCLFAPSIAPMSPHTSSVTSGASSAVVASFQQESSVIGGVGDGDRPFPCQPGLTYSTWICIDKFSDPKADPHPVRLLTIARSFRNSAGEEEHSVCLSVVLSSRDKALLISTKESPLPLINNSGTNFSNNSGKEQMPEGESGARIWFPDLIKEGEWHHLVLVFNRQTLKNSSFTLFVNGQKVAAQKMNYIGTYPGSQSNVTHSTSVFGFIGTPPVWRRHSRLCWKQGPCLLFEDIASPSLASLLYKLGPHYLGSLQAPQISGDVMGSQVLEEKIILGINAVAMSSMTLNKIKKVYSKMDNKSIAKQLGMASGENATPIRIAHNSGSHLMGPARSLGGVVIGYLGVRVFTPQPVSKVIQTVGGSNVLLGIIAMATDMESLYAGVKALSCVLKSNPFARYEMEINKGYQILAMLLGRKKDLLNLHILHLVLTLAGTLDIGSQRTSEGSIPNVPAFKDVLCDLELWHEPAELEKSLFEHFLELVSDNRVGVTENVRQLREFSLVEKILRILKKSERKRCSEETALNLIHALICFTPRVNDVLCFALFTASTLNNNNKLKECVEREDIILRNRCLELFFSLLYEADGNIHSKYCEDVVQVVGFDWIQLFIQVHCHPSTVLWGLKILLTLLSLPNLYMKFRLGTCNGHWLNKSDLVLQNKMVQALGPQSSTNKCKVTRLGIRQDIFAVPGFQLFNWLIPNHFNIPQVYYLASSLTVGQKLRRFSDKTDEDFQKIDLDAIWIYNFGVPAMESTSEKVVLSVDGICTILSLIRNLLDQNDLPDWLDQHATTLTQFLFYLYHNVADAQRAFMTEDVLNKCAEAMFPLKSDEPPEDEFISIHPSKRNLMNFMRILIVDSLSIQSTPKNSPVLDVLLDAKPDNISYSLHYRFQTELLGIVMDHLLAADVLIGGDSQFVGPNVYYLASRLVDKLWTESLKKPPEEIFHFILKLISQSKRRSSAIFSLEGIYRSLNRCILFMLSRENINRPEIRDLISQILCNRSLIFGAGNHELDFFGGLSYCLIQISYNKNICLNGSATESKTTWHVEFSTEPCSPESLEEELKEDCSKIWEELYVTKKPALEEVFKTSFGQQNTTPSLVSVKSQIYDASLKVWNSYIDAESKGLYPKIPAWEFHTQLQSKLQRVTGGLTGGLKRLTSVNGPLSVVKSNKKSDDEIGSFSNYSPVEYSRLPKSTIEAATLAHISVVINVVDQHYKNRAQTEAHMLKFIEEEWIVSEGRLTQERGLWGPYNENCLTKWMIDMTEGPFRMRKKLVRNENFFRDYPYREIFPESDETKTKSRYTTKTTTFKYKKPMSRDSKIWHDLHRPRNEDDDDQKLNVDEYDDCDIIVGSYEESLSIDEQMKRVGIYQGIKPVNNALESSVEENQSPSEDHSTPIINSGSPLVQVPDEEESSDYQTVMRLLEDGENITHMFRCARIQGLDTAEGLLLFGKEHFYILDGFTLVNGREVHDIEYIPDYEPIIPVVPGQVVVVSKREVFKVSYDNVKEVHKRRYLLQPIAVEVFSCDGQNKLLSFTKASRPKVYHRFLSAATSISDSASASVAGQKRSANVEQSSGIFSSMIGETSVTQRWVRGEITNFQYLMALNTLAGRSYNDLMQYPVFPWVLSDYKSDELDLSNPKSFRNLSKPMGAQTDHRLEQFMRRYSEWEDPHTDSPPYHYGTHYSSAMIVSSYMVRCEPFTQHFLHLQGGHFDLPDRMFHSVEEAWDSASRNNMADVRELIPEFFYLPDLFVNHNHFELGTKQNGQVLDDVILPPWAKGSPEEFIRLHREALESDYVSTHLHEWIDLIFGFKQSGPSAIESINVFHHLFYEGSVDIFAIEDPLQRNATIGFINNFGQIPKNLFKKPHPSKKINSDGFSGNGPLSTSSSSFSGNMGVFFHNLTNLRPSTSPIKELKGPVGQIVHGERVYVVEHNKVLVPGNLNRYLAWGNNDQSFRLCNYESDKAIFICEPNYLIGQVLSCVMPNSKTVITAGTSSVIAVYEYLKKFRQLHIKKLLYGHTDAVTCLTASPSWNIAVSGSRDRTAIVWDLSRYAYVKHLVGHIGPIAAVAINELTGDIITTSGSWLYLWDINGRLHASVDTTSSSSKMVCQQILCVTCSEYKEWDRENVIITGSSDGVVRMWSLDYVEVPFIKDSPKKQCRQSKLTTESNEDFVLVEEAGLSIRGKATKICNDGYIWKKGLVLRAKLTMHTAFERPDNVDPAAVTALAISKDHKIVYVGDEKGRVFSWTVSSRPGKEMVDHWWKDEGVESCVDCGVKFTIYERRHHCRNCGKVFCSSCSQYQAEIPRLKIMHPVRVCKQCHQKILDQ
ncbi:WD repeat and FYVE domain-containing protein 3 isoform X2 [Lepeophtheirus salmonis]|uniref:WD repeat and FYVE domain-containing protein 3 isoform X2 n=1 Tax=Lepeophtheirus salmonis TaxID=72036 RepID=UPI001AE5987F|nr:WD repeat and FYVE domain-containing protein 3-like isoform X2 [Lepeophtheirus salmonis]